MSKYSLLVSKPMKWRFSIIAATAVVPLPIVASKTTPPHIGISQDQVTQQVNGLLGGVKLLVYIVLFCDVDD